MPCVTEEDLCHREVTGRTRFYCSPECRWLDESNPGRYVGDRNYFDRFHGMDLADVVRDLGFVRADGKTLMAQPHLREGDRWTLADLEAIGLTIESPNVNTAKAMGLKSGDWSQPFRDGETIATGRNCGPGPVTVESLDLPAPAG